MKRLFRWMLFLSGALLITGCLPHERVWWSPDGSRAAVLLDDGLHVLKPGESPGSPLLAEVGQVYELSGGLSWLTDGSGFVVARTRNFATWEETRKHIPATEAEEVERLSLGVPGWVETFMATGAKAKTTDELLQGSPLTKRGPQLSAFLCAYERKQQLIDAMLKRNAPGQELIKQMQTEKPPYMVHEICVVDLKGAQGGDKEFRLLQRSLHPLMSPQVSPKHGMVAYLRMTDDDDDSGTLEICSLKGGGAVNINQQVGPSFAWSAEGRSLVYTMAFSGTGSVLRRVNRRIALNEQGEIADEDTRAKEDGLALAVMPTPSRVQSLPDGRVLISALPLTLPVVGTEPDVQTRLYLISADGKTLSPVPTQPGSLPSDLGYFVVSPDGKRVAVAEGGTDAVAVVDLDSGKTILVSPAHANWQCRTMPSWKSATELTYAALDGEPAVPKWMVWSEEAGARSLSTAWPAKKTEEWLERKKETKPESATEAKTP